MTRINLVDPSHLTDKHLRGEYKEITRIFTAVRELHDKGKDVSDVDIPDEYVLGNGHCKFFYNKLRWVSDRYYKLNLELKRRGCKPDMELFSTILESLEDIPGKWFNDYKPSPEEVYLNMARLCKRSKVEKVLDELGEGMYDNNFIVSSFANELDARFKILDDGGANFDDLVLPRVE